MRHRFQRLVRLRRGDWWVLMVSLVLLPAVRIQLGRRGFGATWPWLARRSQRPVGAVHATEDARRVAEAVELVAGRRAVGGTCLPRSLTLWFHLRRRGIDAQLCLGAAASGGGTLPAHAWVEVDGTAVNDRPDVRERYGSFDLVLPSLAERT